MLYNRNVQFMFAWPYVLGQNIMVAKNVMEEVIHLMVDSKQEEKEEGKTFKNTPTITCFV